MARNFLQRMQGRAAIALVLVLLVPEIGFAELYYAGEPPIGATLPHAVIPISPLPHEPPYDHTKIDAVAKCLTEVLHEKPESSSFPLGSEYYFNAKGVGLWMSEDIRYFFDPAKTGSLSPSGFFEILIATPQEGESRNRITEIRPPWPDAALWSFSDLMRDSPKNPLHDVFGELETKCNLYYSTPAYVVVQ